MGEGAESFSFQETNGKSRCGEAGLSIRLSIRVAWLVVFTDSAGLSMFFPSLLLFGYLCGMLRSFTPRSLLRVREFRGLQHAHGRGPASSKLGSNSQSVLSRDLSFSSLPSFSGPATRWPGPSGSSRSFFASPRLLARFSSTIGTEDGDSPVDEEDGGPQDDDDDSFDGDESGDNDDEGEDDDEDDVPLSGSSTSLSFTSALKPVEVVGALDDYIVGQADAKRAVAIALRNR